MPRIKSAIKRVEIAERNRLRNKSWRSAVRTVRTKLEDTCKLGDLKASETALHNAYRIIDRAVAKGILHRNSAARKKSRLACQLLSLKGKKASA